MLQLPHCRRRQQRLLHATSDANLDALVLSLPYHVYYLTSHLPLWYHHGVVVLESDGKVWLLSADQPKHSAAADELAAYPANFHGTSRQEQPLVVAQQVVERLKAMGAKRIGIDASPVASQLSLGFEGHVEAIDSVLWELRRAKDPDELELMKGAIRCTDAMYTRAKEIIQPGVPELHVFAELQAAAVKAAGEPLTALLGNDFASGVPGGPPRNDSRAQDGQLYILDLGPCYRGYFADNCRTFSVGERPSDEQYAAYDAIISALELVEQLARPGVRCREIYSAIDEHLRSQAGAGLVHHLGHGVGLQAHEFPHLNPNWDDVLLEGEVFTAEPGIYSEELEGGIRLEQQYLVRATGVQRLTDFPLDLT